MTQNKITQNKSSCDTNGALCSMPDTVAALLNGTELETAQTMFIKTSEGINNRLGWLEYSLFLLDKKVLAQDPIYDQNDHVINDLYTAFSDQNGSTLLLFKILHNFAATFQNTEYATAVGDGLRLFDGPKDYNILSLVADALTDKALNDINFSILGDISDVKSAFYQYVQALNGGSKFDAWFEEYLALKKDIGSLDCIQEMIHHLKQNLNELCKTVSSQYLAIKALAQFSTSVTSEVSNLAHILEVNGILPMHAKTSSVSYYIDSIEESSEKLLHDLDDLNHYTYILNDVFI